MNILALVSQINAWFWIPIGTIFHLIAFFLVTIHCLQNRRESASAILWIFAAWCLPIIGPLLFISFGINRVPTKGWHKHSSNVKLLAERQAREEGNMPLAYWQSVHKALITEPPSPFTRELNNAMNNILADYPLLGGNDIKPLVTGDKAFPLMLDAIDQAEHHIHFQTFIIGNDSVGRNFLEHLKRKAESGVTVRLMYDRFGSTHAWIYGLIRKYFRST